MADGAAFSWPEVCRFPFTALFSEGFLAGSGSYARGEQPRGVPDSLAGPYATMIAQQRAYNARQEAEQQRRRSRTPAAAPSPPTAVAPLADRMYRPSADDVAELRKRQAEFKKTERAVSAENAWMAAPALAPFVPLLGLEAAGAIASRFGPAVVRRAPHLLTEREPYLRVGDNWATRAGRRAHQALKEKVEAKEGWKYEPDIPRPGQRPLKPDVGTPTRKPAKRYYLELKPDTLTGRAAGAKKVKLYNDASKQKARVIYYNPKDFI